MLTKYKNLKRIGMKLYILKTIVGTHEH